MTSSGPCSICLEKYNSTVSVYDTDENNIKWFTKLQFIAPELEWLEEYSICECCIKQLKNAWEFKRLVLNLEAERRLGLIWRSTYSEENIELKDDFGTDCYCMEEEISCKDCSKTFTTQTQFRQHKLQVHDGVSLHTFSKNRHFFNDNKISHSFMCYNCGEEFATKDILLDHIQNEGEEAKVCLISEKQCLNKITLDSHMRDEHGIKACKEEICSTCTQKFETEAELKEHILLCKKFECFSCKDSYNSKKELTMHFKLCKNRCKTNTLKHQCSSCENFYATEKNLNLHKMWCGKGEKYETSNESISNDYAKGEKTDCIIKLNRVEKCSAPKFLKCDLQNESRRPVINNKKKGGRPLKTFSCEICTAQFGYVRLVVEHCISEHAMEKKSVKPYSCDKCDMRFASSANLDQHRHYHDKKRTHVCSLCGKGFITKSDLTVHEYTHYNRRNYKCSKCDKAFNTNKNLRTHNLVVHTDHSLWKYGCTICEKRFPLKTNYDEHMRRHTGEKAHVCHICKKRFISKTEMRRHINLHSNIKAFKCANCGKEYKERRTYEAHLTKIHGIGNAKIPLREKKFVCHICPSQFYDKQKLSKHLCSHSGLKPFPCYACDKRFTDKSYLKHHLKTAHNIIEPLGMEVME